jgi:hypothetical protein
MKADIVAYFQSVSKFGLKDLVDSNNNTFATIGEAGLQKKGSILSSARVSGL